MTSYELNWQRDTSIGCSDEDANSTAGTGSFISHRIVGLEEDSRYSITVTVSNAAGRVSSAVSTMTPEAGERDCN